MFECMSWSGKVAGGCLIPNARTQPYKGEIKANEIQKWYFPLFLAQGRRKVRRQVS